MNSQPPDAYAEFMRQARESPAGIASFLSEELPWFWRDVYVAATPGATNIIRFGLGTFEYIVDDYQTLEQTGAAPQHPTRESRLVVAHGLSSPRPRKRDDHRLRGWVGPTHEMFGPQWDKGHFIGHSLGGAVDGFEANVFVQRRDLNRGWSEVGKRFRTMETFCKRNPGTFCFSRPLYEDETSRRAALEFGALRSGELWVEVFRNPY